MGVGAVATDLTAPGPAPEVEGTTVVDDALLKVVVLDGVAEPAVPTAWALVMALAWALHVGLVLVGLAGALRCLRQRLRRNFSG